MTFGMKYMCHFVYLGNKKYIYYLLVKKIILLQPDVRPKYLD